MRLVARAVPVLALLALFLASVFPPRARGLPLYAARTGFQCQTCHFDPNGGGPRNDFGFAFAKNRHSLTPDTSGAWKDLNLTNRIGDNMPVYLGVNQRFVLLANTKTKSDSLERAAFYNMENALYVTFQPHSRLTLLYDRDAFDGSVLAQDAFGLISGFPWDAYIKAGRFRTPFGLRADDHTLATRNGFLDFESPPTGQVRFLPYDPRFPDMGVEVGAAKGPWFGRAAYTNGAADVFGSQPFAQSVTAKLGFNHPYYQGGVSFYDDYEKNGVGPFRRATRWGYYTLTHWRQIALIGEIAAGTDRDRIGESGKNNLLAGYIEADWMLSHVWNFRLRYDRLQTNRSSFTLVRDANTWDRYAVEGEILPVPFAEVRWVARVIVPKAEADLNGVPVKNEKQAYVQMHFSY